MPAIRSLVVLLLCASCAWADHELRTLDGKTVKGKVVAISDTEITVQSDAGEVKTPLSQVLSVDARPVGKAPPDLNYTLVRLLDDSILKCSNVAFKGKEMDVTLLSGQSAKVPVSSLVSMVREAQDGQMLARWDNLTAAKVKRDRIVILKDGELNTLEGTLGEVDAQGKNISFRRESGETVVLPLDRLHGMIFYRSESPSETAVCLVMDTHGDTLAASKVSVDGDTFKLVTPAGARIDLAEKALAKLDYNMGKLTYLSDMEPAKVVERSGAGLIVRYRRDVNLDGEPIRLGGSAHAKGLSMHAHTELEYDLGGKYKDFKALLGVDSRVSSDSQAQVTIECDGVKVFSEAVSSTMTRPINLNVRDVRRLRIVVSARNFLDLYDHATLADARVSQ